MESDELLWELGEDDQPVAPVVSADILAAEAVTRAALAAEEPAATDTPDGFALFGRNLFGDEIVPPSGGPLADRFTLPPFSVLNAREGTWQDRKRAWLSLGIQSELGRGDVMPSGANLCYSGASPWAGTRGPALPDGMRERVASFKDQDKLDSFRRQRRAAAPGGSARPACDYRNRQRGDGAGRPIDG